MPAGVVAGGACSWGCAFEILVVSVPGWVRLRPTPEGPRAAAASESWAVGLGASGPVPMFDQGFPRGGRFQPRQRDYAWYSTGGGGNQIRPLFVLLTKDLRQDASGLGGVRERVVRREFRLESRLRRERVFANCDQHARDVE